MSMDLPPAGPDARFEWRATQARAGRPQYALRTLTVRPAMIALSKAIN